jgi:large subunit ribosomal protein L4e
MKAAVRSLDGSVVGEIELPEVFATPVREDIIKRTVIAIQSHRLQPYGTKPMAGRDYAAEYFGSRRHGPKLMQSINQGTARKPRLKNRRYLMAGQVANVPEAVHGPKAHPPKVEKVLAEKVNKKERRLALRSAIAATAIKDYVVGRGHIYDGDLPIVVVDDIESVSKTSELKKILAALGVDKDLERAYNGRRRRAGKGERRGRAYKVPKSVLIVVKENKGIYQAARNLPGVDVVEVRNLNVELLAPGAHPGRLTIWSRDALEALKEAM